jgi:hypothetical protein
MEREVEEMRVRCPHCNEKYRSVLLQRMKNYFDDDNAITFGLSRREPVRICTLCTKAEGIADYTLLDDEQARVAVGNDHAEALRLPAGLFHGISRIATGGFDEWMSGWEEVYSKPLERDA